MVQHMSIGKMCETGLSRENLSKYTTYIWHSFITQKQWLNEYIQLNIIILCKSRLSKINIDSTFDRMEYLYRTRIGTRFGLDQVLGYVPGQVGPFQNFGANQMCSSKHLDRTRSGPGSEQIRRVNSIKVTSP